MRFQSNMKGLLLSLAAALAVTACDGETGATGPAGPAGPGGNAGSIQVAADIVTPQANDLRGLTYARVGANAGKLYASGFIGNDDVTRQAVVVRFNADGSPDSGFGEDGNVQLQATAAVGSNDEQSLGITELQGGDVIVAVNAVDAGGGRSVYLFRLNPDGAKVPGWGDADGKVEVAFGWANADNASFPGAPATLPTDTAWDIWTDRSVSDDRVVVFGLGSAAPNAANRTDNDVYVTRLNITSTGAVVDPGFNGGTAFSYHSTGTLNDNARRGYVAEDGSILSSGYTNLGEGLGNHVILLHLTPAGTLDSTFAGFSSVPDTLTPTPGIAVFNPYRDDGGFAECYAALPQSSGGFVTTGYGRATGEDTPSSRGYAISTAPDVVSFRVLGGTASDVDTGWGNNGELAIQSEGKGFPTTEDRGRDLVILPDDRSIQVGRFGGVPAAVVLTAEGQPDVSVFGDGIVELPSATVDSQFFAAALSPDGKRVAMTTNSHPNGARLVILKVAAE